MNNRRPFTLLFTRSLPLAVLTLLLTAHCSLLTAHGQSATATLSGTVEDEKGAVVPGVTVAVLNVDTSFRRESTTNDNGSFLFTLLPPGRYSLTAERQGFKVMQVPSIVLNVGDQKALNIQLQTGNITETVRITGEAPLINESPAVGTVVDRQFVENIPLNGRSFQSLITLTPGVVLTPNIGTTNFDGQFSVNGQRASANAFTVDGVSANFGASPRSIPGVQTSGNLPGLTAFGTTQSLVSVDALQEFKVQTSGYSAEYGRQPGGQISIVTRSGTNDFHGSLFDYIRNDVFDANDWFGNANRQRRPPLRQNDFGGTFGGPILLPRFGEGGRQPGYNGLNRTFFFFSYEGLRLRLPKFALTNVPSLSLRQQSPAGVQPLLNAFPLPNGRDLGIGFTEFSASYSDPSSLDATSIRIDQTFNSKVTLFGRYNQAPSSSVSRFAGNLSLVSSDSIKTKTLTLGLTSLLTSRVTNEFKINWSDNDAWNSLTQDTFGGTVPVARTVLVPSQYDSSSAQGNAQFPFPGRTSTNTPLVNFVDNSRVPQSQLNLVDNVSYSVGAHQFKFGVDFRRLTPSFAVNPYRTTLTFQSAQQVLNSSAGIGTIQAALPTDPIFLNFSAYGQDTWKISRRLTVDLGLRWDVNPPPTEANGNDALAVTQVSNLSTMQLAPRGTKLWKTTYNNFGPRIGLAYQLSQVPGREMILRGGFGVFYDTGNDFSAAQFFSFPYNVSRSLTNITFPLNPSQVAPAPFPIQVGLTPPYPLLNAFDPDLKLPYTLQWNVAAQQELGRNQVFTVSYVGAAGRKLIQLTQFNISSINPLFTTVALATNRVTSDYNSMQAQFQRRLSHGLQVLVSYTWSHAIDEDSISFSGRLAQRGNANFDVRQTFAAAVTYDIPSPKGLGAANLFLSRWSIDTNVYAHSALPVDLVASTFTNPADGTLISIRPNVIEGVPLYLNGPQYPGGRTINNTVPTAAQIAAAGCRPLTPSTPAKGPFCTPQAGQSGSLGRNVLRGIPAWQVDLAVRREFKLIEKLRLQFRAEAFNLFNHPNFGTIQTNLNAANFGQATNMLNRQLGGLNQLYQVGGPRSLQFALKVLF